MSKNHARLFSHMLYEYKKGVRKLALYTCPENEAQFHIQKLKKNAISYSVSATSSGKVNIFFGDCPCIGIVESFGGKMLNELDPKEDFILGVLLGYDITKQCERYMSLAEMPKCKSCSCSLNSSSVDML